MLIRVGIVLVALTLTGCVRETFAERDARVINTCNAQGVSAELAQACVVKLIQNDNERFIRRSVRGGAAQEINVQVAPTSSASSSK